MGTLLVIGNGFDRTLKRPTSYNDFFKSDFYKDTRINVLDWINNVRIGLSLFNIADYNFTCWDLLFAVKSRVNDDAFAGNIKWCDIEKVIYNSLYSSNQRKSFWDTICEIIINKTHLEIWDSLDIDLKIVFEWILEMDWNCLNRQQFYKKLLEELKIFEKRFGEYILSKTQNTPQYNEDASNLVECLCRVEPDFIDSFNYSDFKFHNKKIRHINGDCNNPIFGIDIKNTRELSFIEYFTKTSRRIYQDVFGLGFESKTVAFDRVVVFGHSLNEQDYDYFTYIFTALKYNTLDISQMGTVEFVFHIYDENKDSDIRNRFSDSVYKLLNYYEERINNKNQHVLINLLRFSGKLIIREVDAETKIMQKQKISWTVLQ